MPEDFWPYLHPGAMAEHGRRREEDTESTKEVFVNDVRGDKDEISATFDGALKGLRMTGASVDTRALVELITRHGVEEGRLLATYEELVDTTTDQGVRYLVGLILDDERRHHRLLAEIANSMAWGSLAESPEDSTPDLPRALEGELLAQTKRLRKAERSDYRELRRIRRRLRPFAGTTLWALVIDLMLLDTKKHATILRFLERHGRKR